ncbi:MAG: alpha/beta hydrolase [Bacteroidetes bacterium]|nr:MAG: alpha/beta hydrolase [Bacteroidota bacterium]
MTLNCLRSLRRTILLTLFGTLFLVNSSAQELVGDWFGELPEEASSLKLVFHIDQKDGVLEGTMDSPYQGTFGLKLSSVKHEGEQVVFDLSIFKILFEGKFCAADSLKGFFRQGEMKFPLILKKSEQPLPRKPIRPQDPKPPYPYKEKEVTFRNRSANISLAGTLTIPEGKGPFPAVVLITGSGAQNRDEEFFGHKTFKVLADHLTRKGIAVLRYDDRGVGKSEGDFVQATTADFAFDAASALLYLRQQKKIDSDKIGLIGHSEGGTVATMVASADTQVRFVGLLAAPGIPMDELLLKQNAVTQELAGISSEETMISTELIRKFYDVLLKVPDQDSAKRAIEDLLLRHQQSMPKVIADEIAKQTPAIVANFLSPWFRYFIQIDPKHYLKQIKCPVLAVNGSKDVQVAAIDNLMAIRKVLSESGNKQAYTYIMPDLNHLMQHCETGEVSEYVLIEETFSAELLNIISNWILNLY